MGQIPLELVVKFLEYLPLRDLRNTANVCRLFYRAAQDAGCSVRRTINFTGAEKFKHTMAIFEALVKHATRKPPSDRPGLALRLLLDYSDTSRNTFYSATKQILKALEDSLPLLVELHAVVQACFADTLYGSLCAAPAPRLRTLALGQHKKDLNSPTIFPPANLFKDTAPRLRTLYLDLPTLEAEWKPPAVFQRVVSARLTLYRTGLPISVSRFLPGLQSLSLNLLGNTPQAGTQPELDISGLNLQNLALADHSDIVCTIPGIDYVPFIEHQARTALATWHWSTADTSSSPMSACISLVVPWTARGVWDGYVPAVSLADGRRTRISYYPRGHQLQLPVLPRLEKRLTSVLLDNSLINQFFGINAAMSALLELCIDFTDSRQLSDLRLQSVELTCIALESITLFTLGQSLELRADRVAVLGRMLKQEERPRESHAVLKLVKIDFVRPTPRKQLDLVFPNIEHSQELDSKLRKLVDSSASRAVGVFSVPL
ncbi:hypothetical protein AURDEDRAFT_174321 [Auricularia subglabra TFB-10046 SS5]|nr:hypothetical protein AURDEDRAFT_174321 [Auricularia subglabra TFB-10046 SS5]